MPSYAIIPVRDTNKAWIVEAMIGLLAGPGVRITFDGDMCQTEEEFGRIPVAVFHCPYQLDPGYYCITVPIEDDDALPILRSILHRVGIKNRVRHIEIK